MELILAVLGAGPIGYFTSTRRKGLLVYLAAWTVVFPIQTIVVTSESGSDWNVFYFLVNAVILCGGIGLNRLGSLLRERRHAKKADLAAETA
jgi:hypothetical protein